MTQLYITQYLFQLNSVPELRQLQSSQFQTSESSNQLKDNSHNIEGTIKHNKTEATNEHGKTEDNIISEPVVVDEGSKEPIVDPTILKYRKMIQFGVPRGAVELKMVNEGLDPKLL